MSKQDGICVSTTFTRNTGFELQMGIVFPYSQNQQFHFCMHKVSWINTCSETAVHTVVIWMFGPIVYQISLQRQERITSLGQADDKWFIWGERVTWQNEVFFLRWGQWDEGPQRSRPECLGHHHYFSLIWRLLIIQADKCHESDQFGTGFTSWWGFIWWQFRGCGASSWIT